MSRLVLWPDPRLREICAEVREDTDCSEIIDALIEVKEEHHGLGIAAPQIGAMVRIIVVEDLIVINPRIVKRSQQRRWVWEGCLSFPETLPKYAQDMGMVRDGDRVRVRRHKRIQVEGFDRNWKPFTARGRDWKGACLEHEIEHLDGITLNDHRRR